MTWKALEVHPHRMRWIRESPMREGVSGEQITELVVKLGLRHAQKRDERHPNCDHASANREDGEILPPRQLSKYAIEELKGRRCAVTWRPPL